MIHNKKYMYGLLCWLSFFSSTVYSQDISLNHRIFFVFNQPKFYAGDTAFFRGSLTTHDLKPVSGKKLVNIKLIDSNNQLVLHNRVMFQNGSCINQLILPQVLIPDVYSLLAYTDEAPASYLQIPFVIVHEKEFIVQKETVLHAEESLYETPRIWHAEPLHITIHTDKSQYGVREQVNVEITLTNSDGKPVQTENIISVVHDELFKSTSWQDELQQSMRNDTPDSLNDNSQLETRATGKRFPYYFKGKITLDSIPKSARDSILITFYLTENDFIYGLYADRDGNFEFPLFKEFEDEQIFYILTRKGLVLDKAKIKLDQGLSYKIVHPKKSKTEKTDSYYKFAQLREAIGRSFNYYLAAPQVEKREEAEDWMDADYEVDINKFETFLDMREVLSNIVQMVKYVKRKDGEGVRVFMKEEAMFARRDPLYIINGIMTDDTQLFLNLAPDQVDNIGVLRSAQSLARFGALGKNGIVIVKTKKVLEDLKTKTLTITGINKPLNFYSPRYDKTRPNNTKAPDLRSTLYWNPKLVSDKDVARFSFFTGDAVGLYKIKINGIAEGDQFFSGELTFQVRMDVK